MSWIERQTGMQWSEVLTPLIAAVALAALVVFVF